MNIKRSILLRVRIAFLAVSIFACSIVFKVVYIQVAEGEKWKKLSEETLFDYKKVKATRGNIYSDNGSLLATSLPFYVVAFDATMPSEGVFRKGLDSLSYLLSRFYKDKSALEYKGLLIDARKTDKQYIILNHRLINYQSKKKMSNWPIFREGRYRGGSIFEKKNIRYRPFANLCHRTIGFVNENGKGAGLEFSFNGVLGGTDGEFLFQRIAGGSWKPIFVANNINAIDGLDLQTTIDVNLQDVAETALKKAMKDHDADDGTVVVMEVNTGAIKAISNLSANGNGIYSEEFNHAVGGSFEPGSVFKLATMIALLEETKIQLSDEIDTGNGEYPFYNVKVRDHIEGGFGRISVQRAFEVSSNIAMAKLVDKNFGLRPSRFVEYLDKLNLSKPLKLQIAGESYPKIKRPNQKGWNGITLPWMSYGYGFEMSPLHTLALYNAVANDGVMIKPMFIKAIKKADVVVEEFDTQIINPKICSYKTLLQLRTLLEGVVEEGTASNLKNSYFKIAGKTGTAQILENGSYSRKYTTSFIGYFPAHSPKYSILVLIKNPKGIFQYGNSVAGPVFKEIADNIYARDLQLHLAMNNNVVMKAGFFPVIKSGKQSDLVMLCNELGISNHSSGDQEWTRTAIAGNSVVLKKNLIIKNLMPNVQGMMLRDAIYILEQNGLQVSFQGHGRVSEQSISSGTKILKGQRVELNLN